MRLDKLYNRNVILVKLTWALVNATGGLEARSAASSNVDILG